MEKQKKVIDASVMVKIFSNEDNSLSAQELIKKHLSGEIIIVAPEIIFLEVLNALKYKKIDIEKLNKASDDMINFQIISENLNDRLIKDTIRISIENNFTVYDSLYVALSQIYDCELITADEELCKVPNVKLLKEI